MNKTVIIIVVIIIWILILVGIGIWYYIRNRNSQLSPSPNTPPTPSNPPSVPPATPTPGPTPTPTPTPNPSGQQALLYNNLIQMICQNGSNYLLSTCNTTPCSTYNVTLRTDNNEQAQIWFLSNTQSLLNTPVLYGDSNIILVQGNNLLLGVCGTTSDNCGSNVVAGVDSSYSTGPTTTWTISSASGAATGTNVYNGDIIYLQTNSGNSYLTACGAYNAGNNCGSNVSVSTNTPGNISSQWQLNLYTGSSNTANIIPRPKKITKSNSKNKSRFRK